MTTSLRTRLGGAWLLVCAACTAPSSEPAPKLVTQELLASGSEEVISNAGRYRVLYRTIPETIPSGELFSMLVWVKDFETGEPSADIELVVDAGMPHHQHGMNTRPVLTELAPGVTRADDLLFHMPGAWTVTFDIERAGITERAQVVLDVD